VGNESKPIVVEVPVVICHPSTVVPPVHSTVVSRAPLFAPQSLDCFVSDTTLVADPVVAVANHEEITTPFVPVVKSPTAESLMSVRLKPIQPRNFSPVLNSVTARQSVVSIPISVATAIKKRANVLSKPDSAFQSETSLSAQNTSVSGLNIQEITRRVSANPSHMDGAFHNGVVMVVRCAIDSVCD
jgi:hypothetical protein